MLNDYWKNKILNKGSIAPSWIVKIMEGENRPSNIRKDSEYIYLKVYGIEQPLCKCGRPLNFKNFKKGYTKTCGSKKCEYHNQYIHDEMVKAFQEKRKDPEYFKKRRAKQEKTNLERYGVKMALNNPEIKAKAIATNRKKYGCDYALGNKCVQERIKNTCKKKYGVDNVFASEEIKTRLKEISIEKYGVDNPSKSEIVKKKIEDTFLKKYGVKSCLQSPEVRKKLEDTCLKVYGAKNVFASPQIKEKIKSTLMDKYGVTHPLKNDEIRRRAFVDKSYDYICNKAKEKDVEPLFTREEYDGYDKVYRWKCKNCGFVFERLLNNGLVQWCPHCQHKSGVEKEVLEYVGSLGVELIPNDKTILDGMELDIYIPSKKIAIEVNGTYWHSDERRPDDYHQRKTERCEKLGIRLIHIFEYEWERKSDIIKARLKNILVGSEVYYARKCEIREIEEKDSSEFLNRIHLQGNCYSRVKLGLFDNEKLVAVMTFGIPRFNKNFQWELLRYASEGRVIGGASKLFKYFVSKYNPDSVISYACRNWGVGSLYLNLGFSFDKVTRPNYVYVKGTTVISRYMAQKHLLPDLLGDEFNKNISEYENMRDCNYLRIFDAGNSVFVWHKNPCVQSSK